MRIVIDMQGAQSSGSRNRGIGRYTQSLVKAIVSERGQHEVFIVLNGIFPDSIGPIRALLDGLLPIENIRLWEAPAPVASVDNANTWRRRTAELVREAFLASLQPDIVLVTSLFEGFSDDATTSVALLSGTVPTAVVLYDLIPLIQRDHYLQNSSVESWYENKLDHMRRADLLLAISESSRQEGIRCLGFPEQDCVAISTAADDHFRPVIVAPAEAQAVRERYGLHRDFVMYTGGIDHRKNIEGLIRAYATLPAALRAGHQLAIVCSIQLHSRHELEALARKHMLAEDELVLTGFVSEQDLLVLYNLCKMFVFPSWHEGFGLPALEAMSCGRAVIGAGTSSLPEVIGRADALFDPHSDLAIAEKIQQVLTDDAFRHELERHGLEQARKFSWNDSAVRTLDALVNYVKNHPVIPAPAPVARPKLAYVSPLPPDRSGISDYSAELLPELARHYDIDVVSPESDVTDPWIMANCAQRSVAWFREHSERYDRVVYHFGNSHFHQHMFSLIEEVPGVVVLHDFFLSGIAAHMELTGYDAGHWVRSLYESHGYHAVAQRYQARDIADVIWQYPANLPVLRSALGVIVHSENSRRLAREWYAGAEVESERWAVVPHLRVPESGMSKAQARLALGLRDDAFVICSFGLLGPTKLNDRLLDAWLASGMANDARCELIFVGENQQGEYGRALTAKMAGAGASKRMRITGWADMAVFRQYLAAADVGVQLRTLSRGETSGTVLDCMNYGLPTVVNANGSMADLPEDGVVKLADAFTDADLTAALETLWQQPARRSELGARARHIIRTVHAPRRCADMYAGAIETIYRDAVSEGPVLTRALVAVEPVQEQDGAWMALAQALAGSIPPRYLARQLLVDVSGLTDAAKAKSLPLGSYGDLGAVLAQPPQGFRVEPVYAQDGEGYRYARAFTLRVLGCPDDAMPDEPAQFHPLDVLLLPLPQHLPDPQHAVYEELANLGVQVQRVG